MQLPWQRQRARPWLRAAAAAEIPLAIAAGRLHEKLPLPRVLVGALAAAAPLALAVAAPRSRVRDAGVWLLHMFAYETLFELPYEKKARWRARAHLQPMLAADRAIGLGVQPGRRLQRRLRPPERVTKLDQALTVLYWTWEIAPHLALLWIHVRHPERYRRAAVRLAAAYDLSLLSYMTTPTAPPWYASVERGCMGGEVGRVTFETRLWWKGEYPKPGADPSRGSNPLATMPSDHFLTSTTTAMLLSEAGRGPAAIGWGYALGLGFSLVYLGEHYVIDLLVGLAASEGLRRAEGPARPLVEALAEQVRRLERAAR